MHWPAGLSEFSCSSWYASADHFPSNWSLSVSEKQKKNWFLSYVYVYLLKTYELTLNFKQLSQNACLQTEIIQTL